MCDLLTDPYIAELRAMRARVEESLAWLDILSPATEPALPPVDHPLDRAVAGDPLSTATRSGQVTPSLADTAARGDLIEQGVSA